MTPAFPPIILAQLIGRFVDPMVRRVLTGGTTLLWFTTMVMMPNSFYYAPILLPFALGNAATAASFYLVADLTVGPAALAGATFWSFPLAGVAIGVATALFAPLTYPSTMAVCWPDLDHNGSLEMYDLILGTVFSWWLLPAIIGTGVVVGAPVHALLRPLILGVPGKPWPRLAGGVLASSGVAMTALYSTSLRIDIPHALDAQLLPPVGRQSGLFSRSPLRLFLYSHASYAGAWHALGPLATAVSSMLYQSRARVVLAPRFGPSNRRCSEWTLVPP